MRQVGAGAASEYHRGDAQRVRQVDGPMCDRCIEMSSPRSIRWTVT